MHQTAIAKSYQPHMISNKSQKKCMKLNKKTIKIRRCSNSPGSTEDRDCCKNFCESFIPVNSLVKLAMASCKLRHSKLFCCFQPRCEKQLFSLFKNQHHEKWVQLQVSSHFGCIYQLFSSPKGGFYHQSKVQNFCHQKPVVSFAWIEVSPAERKVKRSWASFKVSCNSFEKHLSADKGYAKIQ